MHARIAALALALPAALLPGLAGAQVNPFRNGWGARHLTNEDFKLLMDASDRLLAHPTLAEGDSESWSNPRSGDSGTVTAEGSAHRRGAPCHVLAYTATSRSGAEPKQGRLTWCKVQDRWRIAS